MASKSKVVYLCTECGFDAPKWQGKCPSCGQWNTLVEHKLSPESSRDISRQALPDTVPLRLTEISGEKELRVSTGINELDRVLGGGMVGGSLLLVSGEPGIGKSTLLLQACRSISRTMTVMYVTGEESLPQIKLRSDRLAIDAPDVFALCETNIDRILASADRLKPGVMIIDSVQTIYNDDISSAPGSVTQVRDCTMTLMRYAKINGTTVILVGHINKDGMIAGPKVLEHMVDTVLSFEGDRHVSYRVLKAIKNRFGSTNEIGVFEMGDRGLVEVPNPSKALLSGRPKGASGSCVGAVLEGTRPLLTEIQALVTKSGYGSARRTSAGIDYNRAVLLLAILEKRVGFMLSTFDAYINIVGGLSIDEPASDLPALLAIASSYLEKPIPAKLAAFGEVGLAGEIRAVQGAQQRIGELARLGFTHCVLPHDCKREIHDTAGLELLFVQDVSQAIKLAVNTEQ